MYININIAGPSRKYACLSVTAVTSHIWGITPVMANYTGSRREAETVYVFKMYMVSRVSTAAALGPDATPSTCLLVHMTE